MGAGLGRRNRPRFAEPVDLDDIGDDLTLE
jgi:hypothetical protein